MNPLLGISLKILSALSFTLMSTGIKELSDRFPTGELVFCRSFFALVPLMVWLGWRREMSDAFYTRNLVGHVKRSILGSGGMYFGFVALSYLPLPDATAISYTTPLIIVILAALVLGETVRFYRWTAVAVGFGGVLVMLLPHFLAGSGASALLAGTGESSRGVVFALAGASCAAAAAVQIRQLVGSEKTGAIVFYFQTFASLVGLSTIVFGWRMPTPLEAVLLVTIGILGGIGQILLTQSYRYADASLIAPFDYTSMVWALLLGWFVFGELPSVALIAGALIVISSGIFVIWRERRLGIERARAYAAAPPRPT